MSQAIAKNSTPNPDQPREDCRPGHSAPGLCRRTVIMNTAVSVASLVSSAAIAMPSLESADAELIALCQKALDLSGQFDEADAAQDDLYGEYQNRLSDPPWALRWHPIDPVDYRPYSLKDGRDVMICDEEDIQEKRGQQIIQEEWLGTAAQYNALPEDSSGKKVVPESMKGLMRAWPDEYRQQRLEKIVSAHDQYQAELKAIRDELGFDAAEARVDKLLDELRAMENTIERTPAKTIKGIRSKALVLAYTCWNGKIERDWNTTDHRLAASIVADLTGLPNEMPLREDDSTDTEAA
jgi:hypothetical protein